MLGLLVPKNLRSWNVFNLVYFTIYSYASCFIAWVSLCHYFFIYIYYIRAFHAWYAIICQWNKGLYLLLHYMYGIMNLEMYIVPKSWYLRIPTLRSNKSIWNWEGSLHIPLDSKSYYCEVSDSKSFDFSSLTTVKSHIMHQDWSNSWKTWWRKIK